MKRLILLLFCILVTQPAFTNINYDLTVQRCVAETFNFSACTPTTQSMSSNPQTPDWEMTCTITGTSKKQIVHGVAMCSSTELSIPSATETLEINTTSAGYATANKHCYCRVTIPEPTPWVILRTYTNYSTCLAGCRVACTQEFATASVFRNIMAGYIYQMLDARGNLH